MKKTQQVTNTTLVNNTLVNTTLVNKGFINTFYRLFNDAMHGK